MKDSQEDVDLKTPHEEALALAPQHAVQEGKNWVFRWDGFDVTAASKKDLLDQLAEAINYKREYESRPPMLHLPAPTREELDALAMKFGMQSPEFMEAADALMMSQLRGLRKPRDVGESAILGSAADKSSGSNTQGAEGPSASERSYDPNAEDEADEGASIRAEALRREQTRRLVLPPASPSNAPSSGASNSRRPKSRNR